MYRSGGLRALAPPAPALRLEVRLIELVVHDLAGLEAANALIRLAGRPNLTFLDSAMRHDALGRFSYLMADPFATFTVRDGQACWNGMPEGQEPVAALKHRLAACKLEAPPGLPPLVGGAAGVFAYEFAHALEKLPRLAGADVPDAVLHFYDVVLAFDHVQGCGWLISSGLPEDDADRRRERAEMRAVTFLEGLGREQPPRDAAPARLDWKRTIGRQAYEEQVARVVEYILAGDIFQANIAQRFEADLPEGLAPLDLYLALRQVNPATFSAWLDYDEAQVASCSPERFLRLQDGMVETRPIKGTVRRAADPSKDAALARQLLESEKDRAENVMIVDLLRNDLSRVCRPGSVDVPSLCEVESYAGLHHLVSVVRGRLREGLGAADLLAATFPGGSITGAPKIRAMEIIGALEQRPRGVYCGSIGWLGFDGSMDTSIAIRTVTMTGRRATFSAGGGITALSKPAEEYEETLVKADRILAALGGPL